MLRPFSGSRLAPPTASWERPTCPFSGWRNRLREFKCLAKVLERGVRGVCVCARARAVFGGGG